MTTPIVSVFFASGKRVLPIKAQRLLQCVGIEAAIKRIPAHLLMWSIPVCGRTLVLVDADLDGSWTDIAHTVQCRPDSRFVMLCRRATPTVVRDALLAGLHGLICLNAPVEESSQALLGICAGERRLCFEQPDLSGLGERDRARFEPARVLHTASESLNAQCQFDAFWMFGETE